MPSTAEVIEYQAIGDLALAEQVDQAMGLVGLVVETCPSVAISAP